jgi:cytidylate kinase
MPIVAMTREMGSLGSTIAQEVARRLHYQFLRNDILREAARQYRVRESRLVGMVEQAPGLVERLRRPRTRYRAYLEAAVLEAALPDRVVFVGRWSTLFLRRIAHAARIRVCAPPDVRARRVMERRGIDAVEATRGSRRTTTASGRACGRCSMSTGPTRSCTISSSARRPSR